MTGYLAAPLFTQAERRWNAELAKLLRARGCRVILPQEKAEKMLTGKIKFDAQTLFDHAVNSLEKCDVVIAVLDGPDPDSGTSWECGYAWKLGRPIIGVRTDLRPGGDDPTLPVNLMLGRSCQRLLKVDRSMKTVKAIADQIDVILRTVRVRDKSIFPVILFTLALLRHSLGI